MKSPKSGFENELFEELLLELSKFNTPKRVYQAMES
jgi:hypothetical protein